MRFHRRYARRFWHFNEPANHGLQTAKFWLSPVRPAYNYGFAPNELNRIQGLVQRHEAELIKAWHETLTCRVSSDQLLLENGADRTG